MAARIFQGILLAKVARENHRKMRSVLEKLPAKPEGDSENDQEIYLYETYPIKEKAYIYAAVTIIFSTIALESYIYDVACRTLGDSYTEDWLCRVDLRSKWQIIPRLIADYQINTDEQAWEKLTILVKARNNLIHQKSKDFVLMNTENLLKYINKSTDLYDEANIAIEALDLLMDETESFDSDGWGKRMLGEDEETEEPIN